MVALIQRCLHASVVVGGCTIGSIVSGIVVFLGFESGDDAALDGKLIAKLLALRCFSDDAGKMNRNVQEAAGNILLIPNFTLAGECEKGNRPSFTNAMAPAEARERFARLVAAFRARWPILQTGEFGAHMLVDVANDGPVSLLFRLAPSSSGAAP